PALPVDPGHPGGQRARHPHDGLAHAAEDAAVGRYAGEECAVQLAAAHDVRPGPFLSEQTQDGKVAVGLDRVGDQAVERRERVVELAEPLYDALAAVDVQRRAELSDELCGRDVLAVQASSPVTE